MNVIKNHSVLKPLILACILGVVGTSCASEVEQQSEPEATSAQSAEMNDKIAVLFIGGFGTSEEKFQNYFHSLNENFKTVVFQPLTGKWLDPDHWKELAEAEKTFNALIEQGHEKIFLIGYSAGGKHAAKIALRQPARIASLLLLDPVDGGMGADNEKTPIFLKDGDMIRTPTTLIASEFGHVPKILDRACAPQNRGHLHFRQHINDEDLLHYEVIKGSSHLNFVAKPWSLPMTLACDNGTTKHEAAMEQILGLIKKYTPRHWH